MVQTAAQISPTKLNKKIFLRQLPQQCNNFLVTIPSYFRFYTMMHIYSTIRMYTKKFDQFCLSRGLQGQYLFMIFSQTQLYCLQCIHDALNCSGRARSQISISIWQEFNKASYVFMGMMGACRLNRLWYEFSVQYFLCECSALSETRLSHIGALSFLEWKVSYFQYLLRFIKTT